MSDRVVVRLWLDEPYGVTEDVTDPMPRYYAEVALAYVPLGLLWHPGDRAFGLDYGWRVCRARIEPVAAASVIEAVA